MNKEVLLDDIEDLEVKILRMEMILDEWDPSIAEQKKLFREIERMELERRALISQLD